MSNKPSLEIVFRGEEMTVTITARVSNEQRFINNRQETLTTADVRRTLLDQLRLFNEGRLEGSLGAAIRRFVHNNRLLDAVIQEIEDCPPFCDDTVVRFEDGPPGPKQGAAGGRRGGGSDEAKKPK